jgi:hypothetical protein
MALSPCRECGVNVSTEAKRCPRCGIPFPTRAGWQGTGRDWKSEATLFGMPLVHVAYGRDAQGRIRVARGFIAIGQFAIGFITIAQFGIGWIFGLGQAVFGTVCIGQAAVGLLFGLGQLATGYAAIGQLAVGVYVIGQAAIGEFVWSPSVRDPEAVAFFRKLAEELGLRF